MASVSSISPVGSYVAAPRAVAASNDPVGGGYSADSYTASSYGSTGSGLSVGRMAAWGGGVFAALKWLRPVFASSSGWLTVGIAGLGFLVGDKLYHMVSGK